MSQLNSSNVPWREDAATLLGVINAHSGNLANPDKFTTGALCALTSATLEVAEQLRIANLIALDTPTARKALHTPETAETLGLTQENTNE